MKIVLLDLNVTLVENTQIHNLPFNYNVSLEKYRTWLIRMLFPYHVIILTARPENYEKETLERLLSLENWQPNEAYFKPRKSKLRAPETKLQMLEKFIYPRYGRHNCNGNNYIAIESNATTRQMYSQQSIPTYTQQQIWKNNEFLTGPII